MGGMCSEAPRIQTRTVTELTNSIPGDRKYKAVNCESIRLCDVTAYKKQRNQYQFSMTVRNQVEDIKQTIPVLNQVIHCIGCDNYELEIDKKVIIDIFDKRLESSLFEVKNLKTLRQYSMKIVKFQSYTNNKFKQALYQLHLNKILAQKYEVVHLLDYFVFGMNPDHQTFVFLFEKSSTNLANVAEYRKQANMYWTQKEKLKIIYEIFQSYQVIHDKNIIHRDLRPSNVYFVPSLGKFMIGNFSRARQLHERSSKLNRQEDLMSVCGIQQFSCQNMKKLMMEGQQIGYYDGLDQDYAGLQSILNTIQTCQLIYDKNPVFSRDELAALSTMLARRVNFKSIMDYLEKIMNQNAINKDFDIGDRQISESASILLSKTHQLTIQNYIFEAYGALGYSRQYSDKAHLILNYNKDHGRELENAPILYQLAQFYENKGARGTQYYYNSFILYINRAESQIRYGYPDKAEKELQMAKDAYFKFNKIIESDLPRLEINRIEASIQCSNHNIQNAKQIITETFVRAAKCNIPVEKQCKILLEYGKIFRKDLKSEDEALKKLVTGLNICDNGALFDSPVSNRIIKSKFLRQIGQYYSDKNRLIVFKKDNQQNNEAHIQIKAQAETYLKQALEIQEREAVDDLEVADTLESIGNFYYCQRRFYEAKRYLEAAKIRFAHIKENVNQKRQLFVLYSLGSCNYYLKEYSQSKNNYATCLAVLEKQVKTEQNQVLTYNIEGNYGLSLLRIGNPQGKQRIQRALEKLKQIKGENSYDYASLNNNYVQLIENQ